MPHIREGKEWRDPEEVKAMVDAAEAVAILANVPTITSNLALHGTARRYTVAGMQVIINPYKRRCAIRLSERTSITRHRHHNDNYILHYNYPQRMAPVLWQTYEQVLADWHRGCVEYAELTDDIEEILA